MGVGPWHVGAMWTGLPCLLRHPTGFTGRNTGRPGHMEVHKMCGAFLLLYSCATTRLDGTLLPLEQERQDAHVFFRREICVYAGTGQHQQTPCTFARREAA